MHTVLLIDAGNSALKWAMADAHAPSAPHRVPYDDPTLEARLESVLTSSLPPSLPSERAPEAQRSVVGSLVASEALRAQIDRAAARAHTPVLWLQAQAQFDNGIVRLSNGYSNPEQLGADRWHALLGARLLHNHVPLVLVQVGTATTLDGISAQGHFVGGEILPGPTLMQTSLARGTARLPPIQGTACAFADNTADAIASGVRDAQLGALQRYWRRFVARYAPEGNARLVFTGGGADPLAAALANEGVESGWPPSVQHNLEPDLVLRGLWLRWKYAVGI